MCGGIERVPMRTTGNKNGDMAKMRGATEAQHTKGVQGPQGPKGGPQAAKKCQFDQLPDMLAKFGGCCGK